MSASEQLAVWGLNDESPETLPIVLLPYPLAFLVGRGRWQTILLQVRWHRAFRLYASRVCRGPIQDWPPHDAAVWQMADENGWCGVASSEP